MEKKHAETSLSIVRNILFGFSTFILPLGLSFVATPIIIANLGLENYGIFMLVLGFVGFSGIFSFSRAITKYIAEFRSQGKNEKIPDIISAAFFVNLIIGFVCILVIWQTADWLVSDVLKIDAAAHNQVVIALLLVSLIIFLAMLTQIWTAILQGIHRFDVYSKIFNLNNIAVLSGNIWLASYGFGMLSLLVWNLTIGAIICLIFAKSTKRLLPEFKLSLSVHPKTLKLLAGFSAGNIVYQLLSSLFLFFERGWITRYFGAENLTYYVVPMTVALYIPGFITSLMLVIFPLASELKDNKEKLLRLYLTATKTVCFFVIFLAATLMVESKFFLTLWLGAEFADKTVLLLIIHTITFSLVAIASVSWQMTEGLGYPNYNCFLAVICYSISIILMIGLTESYGNQGVAVGRLGGWIIIFMSIFYVEKWFFGRVQREFWLKLLGILAVSVFFSTLFEKLIIASFAPSWTTFAAANLGGGIIYWALAWLLGFADEEEKRLVLRIFSR